MWTIVFSKNVYNDLREFLFSNAPYENGCFLLASSYETTHDSIIMVTDVIKPNKDSWNYNSEHSLEPSSTFINQCVNTADKKNSSLIFVHTHPNSTHPSGFSCIDEESNSRIFKNLSQILINLPLGSLVFSRKGICGVVYDKNELHSVYKIKIIGNLLFEFPGIGFDKKLSNNVDDRFDRQIRVIGKNNQNKLEKMMITVVGVGGVGSAVAVQLVRMGVKRLQLIDMDIVDKTNVPRVYGSNKNDVGKSKVSVIKKYIESFSYTQVDVVQNDITDEKIKMCLVNSDVIFGCTDNLASRSVLNDISNRYFIPLIDAGCSVRLNNDSSISQVIAKVQIVTPDSACLWCTGTLDGKIILQESYSDEEKQKLAKEGYYENIEKQPSIISLTTLTASMAITKLLNILGIFGDDYSSRTQIELKNGFMINDKPEIQNNCICRINMGKVYPKNQHSNDRVKKNILKNIISKICLKIRSLCIGRK